MNKYLKINKYIKSHHSDQLIQRQYQKTTDIKNAPQDVYKIRLKVIWSDIKKQIKVRLYW